MQLRNSYTTLGSVKCKPLPLPRSNGPYHLSSVGCKRKLEGRSCGHVRAVADDRGYLLADADVVERVLRYPDGQERRIRYPVKHAFEEEDVSTILDSTDALDRGEDWWGIEAYYYGTSSDEEEDATTSTKDTQKVDIREETETRSPAQDFPNSPAELLRFINSEEFKSAAEEKAQLVRQSYQVVEHSPWLQTRSLFVLATAQSDSENFMTYTLRTRVSRPNQEDELTKVLGRKRADGSSLIRVEEIRDGVIAFEDENDAHRYASLLEADGTQIDHFLRTFDRIREGVKFCCYFVFSQSSLHEAVVAECDSHTLFREIGNTRACVVLIKECNGLECHLPLPEELRSSLRGKRSLEDAKDL